MADTAVLLEIITYIFQRTPPTADCDEPLTCKMSTCTKCLLSVAFVINWGICLDVITSHKYLSFATRNYHFNDLSRGVIALADHCQEARDFFWNALIRENMRFSTCIKRNDTRNGIFGYFVNENFVGTTLSKESYTARGNGFASGIFIVDFSSVVEWWISPLVPY